ncbi:unnamed protein product, partial [Didymodactylos carnosus]
PLLLNLPARFPIIHDQAEMNCFAKSKIPQYINYYLDENEGSYQWTDSTSLYPNWAGIAYGDCLAVSINDYFGGTIQSFLCDWGDSISECRVFICDYGAI